MLSLKSISLLLIFSQLLFAGNRSVEIEMVVKSHSSDKHLHGTVLVAENGKIIYSSVNGWANKAWNIKNSIDTKYRIYSMSKQFTAMLIMQLVEEGRIDLDVPISRYLPWYRKDVAENVTVHHLLTHTHGIEEDYNRLPASVLTEPTQELIEKYFTNPLDFEPGSQFRYGGLLGYILLGAIVESVTGEIFRNVLQKNILDPLQMTNSYYLDYKQIIPGKAEDYLPTEKGLGHRIQAYPVNADGASCLVTTAGDLLKWDQALYGEQLLSEKFKDVYLHPHEGHSGYYYAYGWHLADLTIAGKQKRIFYHTGGGSCIIFRLPEENQTVILLNNIWSNELYNIGIEILKLIAK